MTANNQQIADKILRLRTTLESSAYGVDNSALNQVNKWEKDLQDIFDKSQYYDNPVTQALIADAREVVRVINIKLLAPKRLETAERDALIAKRSAFEWYLRLLDRDFKKEEEAIEQSIDFELAPENSGSN